MEYLDVDSMHMSDLVICAVATALVAGILVLLLRPRSAPKSGGKIEDTVKQLAALNAVIPGVEIAPRAANGPAPVIPVVAPCPDADVASGAGNFPDFASAGGMVPYTHRLYDAFGETCVFRFGPHPTVFVGSAALMKDLSLLVDRPPEFFKSVESLLTEHSIQMVNGEEWRNRRLVVSEALTHEALRSRAYSADTSINVLIDAIDNAPIVKDNGDQVRRTLDMREPVVRASFVGFVSFALGLAPSAAEVTVAPLLNAYFAMWPLLMRKSILGDVLTEEEEKKLAAGLAVFHNAADKLLAERRTHVRHERERARENDEELKESGLLVDAWATNLNQDSARADFVTFLFAGFHTTGLLIMWSLLHVAKNKDLQDTIRAELKAGQKVDESGDGDFVSVKTAEGSKSLDMLINETLRIEGLGSFAVRTAPKPTTVGGVVYPEGTHFLLGLSVLSLNHDWEKPREFCPARFAPAEGKTRCPFALPFGQGRRRCPGYDFAILQAKLQLSAVLCRYDLSLPPGIDPATVKRDGSFVPTPVGDMPLIATRI